MNVVWVDSVFTLGLKMAPSTRSSSCPTAQGCILEGSALSNKIIAENDIKSKKTSETRISAKTRERPSSKSKGHVPKKKENGGEQKGLVSDMEDMCQPQMSLCSPSFSDIEVMEIRSSLLDWYDKNHRVLPWRINTHSLLNPVSESEEGGNGDNFRVKKDGCLQGAPRKKSAHSPLVNFPPHYLRFFFFLFLGSLLLNGNVVHLTIQYCSFYPGFSFTTVLLLNTLLGKEVPDC